LFRLAGVTLLLLPLLSSATPLSGRVSDIPDANRLILLTENGRRLQIALVGLALPDPDNLKWRHIAKRHLHMLIAGRVVSVETTAVDRRGVILGVVRHGGADVGLRLLNSGLAVIHKRAPPPADIQTIYQQAQQEARRRGMGYWQHSR
jgi:endonuclease YncB( thermonuclease family)